MARLSSLFARTPEAKSRLKRLSGILFILLAALGWWTVASEGATPARFIAAIAASIAAVLEVFFPMRRGFLRSRRSRRTPGDEGGERSAGTPAQRDEH
jgi:hypothetical protein